MAQLYSRKSLAELIASGHDTASAANYFGRKLSFIQSEQRTSEYQRLLERLLKRSSQQQQRIGRDGEPGKDGEGSVTPYFVKPVKRGVKGRVYRGVRPVYRGIRAAYRGVKGKPFRGIQGTEAKPRSTTAPDILNLFDGQPDLVREYMLDLVREAISENNFTDDLLQKLIGIEDRATTDQTNTEIISILNALPRGQRLSINWFDGDLSIPTNTASWHGQFQLRTAYSSGSIVVDGGNVFIYIADIPATNTTRPGADTARAEHLDAGGSPTDLTNATKSGLTFTFSRRNGESINLTITEAELLSAVQGMTTGQKTSFRQAINAQVAGSYAPAVHNHDGRYYTESESNTRFAPRSHSHNYAPNSGSSIASLLDSVLGTGWRRAIVGPAGPQGPRGLQGLRGLTGPAGPALTATALLTLLAGFSTTQEGQAVDALGIGSVNYDPTFSLQNGITSARTVRSWTDPFYIKIDRFIIFYVQYRYTVNSNVAPYFLISLPFQQEIDSEGVIIEDERNRVSSDLSWSGTNGFITISPMTGRNVSRTNSALVLYIKQ